MIFGLWEKLMNSKSVNEENINWNKLLTLRGENDEIIKYLKNTWYNLREHFIKVYNFFLHFNLLLISLIKLVY
jgi:hypothetical protein